MKHFGTKYRAVYSDTVYSHEPPPPNLMEGGFYPSTPSNIGSPIVAQWFNWLFGSLTALSPFAVTRTGTNDWTFKNPFSATVDGLVPVVKAVRITLIGSDMQSNRAMIYAIHALPVGAIAPSTPESISVSGSTMTVKGSWQPAPYTTILVEPIGEQP